MHTLCNVNEIINVNETIIEGVDQRMAANMPAPSPKPHPNNTSPREEEQRLSLAEPKKTADKNKKVHLEFPYSDLELLYEYTLKELGITDPFQKL